MPDDGQQCGLVFTVTVGLPVLDIDDADDAIRRRSDDRYGKKCFVLVLRKRVKDFETRISARVPRNRDRLDFLRYPTSDSLTDPHRNFADQSRMRVLRCPQYKVLARLIDQINQAGITMRYIDHQIHDLPQDLVQIETRADGLTDLIQDSEFLSCKIQRFLDIFD